ncbi:MAG TPA: phosphoribosylglycinamide formyltransferase [Candidatus Marinimicrobia bacterium]|jgi:formyltetrahydrofolate-dependent phosphoribosylglycinamide formyltransferase|nr:phosphoribosylglycinamide formyltransferase [Rhodobiaceae bacterium]MDP6260575.1 phosphoribosylglycinamide formyltransferase [Candidatus Neomarinimicrobiota bacterium]MDP7565911.1 phosphoribosylglycinamide formyltransferase [Candidatus Neomarinimicrobiota bacterium]MEE1505872.1 phosphoribosylglycinamide formyltransferase [Candidatus Neomarinimicrobiota bacterium]MEE1572533.1 phosphoribosylglycinamide formyltransferase [Candidatus Neomarinimicrobiota bacterium]|tara:strand:- start:1303 stop:1887 length:585 start_codon:yes stop_codon:yes gene_type:complete
MIKLGVIGSTNGTDLQFILDAIGSGKLNAEVSVVLSNQKNAYILERAENHNVLAVFISHKGKSREKFDAEVTAVLQEHGVSLVLLIGFMRILSAEFCRRWQDRLLNVHPSLLPKYGGGMDTNVHEEVLKNGDKETGCTIHFVTEEVDKGPILIQKKCKVEANDTVKTLKAKVQKLEGEAFKEAIQLIQNNFHVR